MSKKHQYILRKNGIDADRYLSMRIDKESIPDGAEVVIQIKDKDTGELRTVPVSTAFDGYFGKNSRFYMQVMNDGHVFNPYIHRRFLPAQFQRNIRTAGYNGIHNYVREQYSWNYAVRFLKEECAKLAMLQRRDPEAFRERSQFFTLRDIQNILRDYCVMVMNVLTTAESDAVSSRRPRQRKEEICVFVKGIGMIRVDHIRPMKYRFEKFCDAVDAVRSYGELSVLMQRFDFCKLDPKIRTSELFARRFVESGAFYTLKQKIMFEGFSLGGRDVMDDLRLLKERGRNGYMNLYRAVSA